MFTTTRPTPQDSIENQSCSTSMINNIIDRNPVTRSNKRLISQSCKPELDLQYASHKREETGSVFEETDR